MVLYVSNDDAIFRIRKTICIEVLHIVALQVDRLTVLLHVNRVEIEDSSCFAILV